MARDIDPDSGRPFIKVNHPAPGAVIAEGSTQGGSNGVIGAFKANLEFDRGPNRRLGVVEAFEESASGSGEDLYLDRVPIVFD
jgi:hypothetical protein